MERETEQGAVGVYIRLDMESARRVREAAEADSRKMSAWVRLAVTEKLERDSRAGA